MIETFEPESFSRATSRGRRTAVFALRIGSLLSAAGLAFSMLIAIPTIWLRWEIADVREQARKSVDGEALDTQAALRTFVGRFDNATARLRLPEGAGDSIALNERLLRAEAVVSPAVGLTVLNGRGTQVASTTASNQTATLGNRLRDQAFPPSGQVAFMGCGSGLTDILLVRAIEGGWDKTGGLVLATMSANSLRSIAMPEHTIPASRFVNLRSTTGCDIARHEPALVESSGSQDLLRFLIRHLPVASLDGVYVTAEEGVANLMIAVSEPVAAAFEARAAVLEQRARPIIAFAGGMAALIMIVGFLIATWVGSRANPLAGPTSTDGGTNVHSGGPDKMFEGTEGFPERDLVLAAIGHDIRTPVNSIMGICALLLDGDLSASQRKWQQRIRASCEALLAITNGMLEVATARLDRAALNFEAVDVGSLAEEVGDVLRHQAEDKGLELTVTLDDSVMGFWRTDSTRLRQVLYNLCGNAIKYTAEGSVRIDASVTLDAGGICRLRLQVTDTGPGINVEERRYIFDRYKRGREDVCRGQEGVGLGLALCRDIATLLMGDLSVESDLGTGSSFVFDIPVERATSVIVTGGPLTGRSALVVGFTEGMRRGIAGKLERLGMVVDTTGDGFLASGFAERMFHKQSKLDLLVLDAALRGLAADVILARLQAIPLLASQMRTVLVSNGEVPASMSGRADATIPHPVETRTLETTVGGLFGDGSILREVYPRAPSPPAFRVLVVEDSRTNQILVMDRLTRAGISAHPASNGREAVEAAGRGGFDAILMDVQMPEMDGLQATRLIRATENPDQGVPIIGMTAHTGPMIRRECVDAGMDLVLHKPLDFPALPLRVKQVMALRRVHVDRVRDASENKPSEAPEVSIEHLDEMVAEFGHKRATAYIDAFLSETQPNVSKLETACSDARWRECMQLAHKLAGLSSSFGALTFSDSLLAIEDAARNEDVSRMEEAVAEVRQAWARTRVEVGAWLELNATHSARNTSQSG